MTCKAATCWFKKSIILSFILLVLCILVYSIFPAAKIYAVYEHYLQYFYYATCTCTYFSQRMYTAQAAVTVNTSKANKSLVKE